MKASDEAPISEITILPDGRICIFGASRSVLEAIEQLGSQDAALQARLKLLRSDSRRRAAGQPAASATQFVPNREGGVGHE